MNFLPASTEHVDSVLQIKVYVTVEVNNKLPTCQH